MAKGLADAIAFLKTCETGFVTDALNLLGIRNCWVDKSLPFTRGRVAVGPAFTAQLSKGRGKSYSLYDVAKACPEGSFLVFAGMRGEVFVGGNIMTNCHHKGIVGVVMDGRCRDADTIAALPMPVFSEGVGARLSTDLRITAIDLPVECNGAAIAPGDMLIGDSDGVVSIPQERLEDVLYQTEWVATVERQAVEALEKKVGIDEFVAVISRKKTPRP